MGLLDAILGGMMSSGPSQSMGGPGAQGQNPLLQIVLQMLQQNGGLQGMLGKMQQAGHGDEVQSWIGTGQNMPIDAGVLSQIFGQGQMEEIAQQLGVSHDEAAGQVAGTLPNVVDRMTPDGQIPEGHSDLVNEALAILQRQRGG
jgi:uncharacterized protein YidB (DUF937 family)